MMPTVRERVNAQGFLDVSASRWRKLTSAGVQAEICESKKLYLLRLLLGFCQRQYFLFAALHGCHREYYCNSLWKWKESEQGATFVGDFSNLWQIPSWQDVHRWRKGVGIYLSNEKCPARSFVEFLDDFESFNPFQMKQNMQLNDFVASFRTRTK